MKDNTLKKRKAIEKLFAYSLVIYPLIHFAVFWIYVNFGTVISTFTRYNFSEYVFCGFDNYVRVFKKMILGEDPALHRAFFNSFMAIGINAIVLPIAIFSAYAFYKGMPGTKIYSVAFYIPQLISMVVLTMVFKYMFRQEFGPVALLCARISGHPVDFVSMDSDLLWPLIWLYCIWSGLGSNVIMIRGAMLKVPKEVEESAILDGCGFFRELRSIVIPLCMSTISIYILSSVMSAASFTMAPYFLAGGSGGKNGRFMTVSLNIFMGVSGSASPGAMITYSTMGVFFTIVLTPIVLIVKAVTKKLTPEF